MVTCFNQFVFGFYRKKDTLCAVVSAIFAMVKVHDIHFRRNMQAFSDFIWYLAANNRQSYYPQRALDLLF